MDRPLDGLESTFILASKRIGVLIAGVAHVQGALPPAAVRGALDLVQAKHPLLGVHVREAPEGPRFVSAGTPPIPLRTLTRAGPQHWLDEVHRELATPLPLDLGPLVRGLHLHGAEASDLLLTFNHTISDGLSCTGLFRDVLALAAELKEGKRPHPAPVPEVPPMRALLRIDPASPEAQREAAEEGQTMLRAMGGALPASLRRDAEVPVGQRTTRLWHRVLEPEPLAALVAKARSEEAGVAAALGAAVLLAAAEDLGKAATLGLQTPVSLRPMLPPLPRDAFGYHSWGVNTFHAVAPGMPLWDLAREVRRKVQGELDRGAPRRSLVATEVRAAAAWQRGPDALVAEMDKYYPTAVAASNLGRFDGPTRFGDLDWAGVHFAASSDAGGAHFGYAGITFRDRLLMNFVHPRGLIADARGEALVERTLALLRGAVG